MMICKQIQIKRHLTGHVIASWRKLVFALVLLGGSAAAGAGTLEMAKRIHDRLAGVPPTESVLLQMKSDLDAGDGVGAAMRAMEHDAFYNVTVKNWAAPWTNREQDVFVPLNDYTATVVGFVRDSETMDFRQLLYADILYVGDSTLGLSAYSNSNNTHYEQLEAGGYSLKDNLVQRSQAALTGLPAEATAGIVTSRAAARSFFKAGTNRANFRFTLLNHLCMDLEQVHDTTRVPDRIRQDVSRSPGGDSRVFLNSCVGCHSGMDPLAQAFAYYDYEYDADNDLTGENGAISYNGEGATDARTGTRVKGKYHINAATFPYGYQTPDDKWDNYWREGPNQNLGWDEALSGSGSGARSMLQELAHTEAFASCQVSKVFKAVCLRDPGDASDRTAVSDMLTRFKNGGYRIKQVFAESADYCKGE
ncbi:hypothetical protein [Teredinibacter haidensis]|uniref:hypothetical protein n=1 Tax=Teredinibacter haidensis TaxID=2731755 RepID=UPI000B1A543A|nr:hypothetical protein [Teredinibacter haidensis]